MTFRTPPQLQLPEGWEDRIVPFDMPVGSDKHVHFKIKIAIQGIYKAHACRAAFTHDEDTANERYLLRLQGLPDAVFAVITEMQQLDVRQFTS